MSETIVNKTRTEFVIALDEDEDETDESHINNDIVLNDSNDLFEDDVIIDDFAQSLTNSVSQTLQLVLDTIETNDNHNNNKENVNKQNNCDINNKSQNIENNVETSDRNPLPIDVIEDVDDMEVNIYRNESNDSIDFENEMVFDSGEEEADNEAEDCMILDDMTNRFHNTINDQFINKENLSDFESINDEIVFIEECNSSSRKQTDKEIINISDDEEDCVLIEHKTTDLSLNKPKFNIFGRNGFSTLKRSHSPIYSSDSFIPLSQPSTSGFRSHSDRNSLNHNSFRKSGGNSNDFDRDYRNTIPNTSRSLHKTESIPFLYDEPKPSTSETSIGSSSDIQDIDLIADCVKLEPSIVRNVVNLIEDQCTVPFIARYRQSVISGIDADKVRRINSIYNELKEAKERAKDVETILRKQNRLNPRLQQALNRCKNVFEVEHLYRLCRNECEESEKYKNLGLSDSAISVLEGKRLNPEHFVNRFAVDIDSVEAVTEGWSAIIVDIISKDCDVLEFLISSYRQLIPTLEVVINEDKVKELLEDKSSKEAEENAKNLIKKYSRFNSFKKPIDKISAHCLMAIERGEDIELLKVYIEFAPNILNKLIDYCLLKWSRAVPHFLVNCVRKAFNNQLKPSLADYIRWELRHSAHMTALDVFRNNVKYLLLEPPLRGETVIGVDPGFDSGCKIAVVSAWGVPLQYIIVKLDTNYNCDIAAQKLKDLMITSDCSIIALGNGSGCRKFEDLLLQKIRSNFFRPIDVRYKIISESGVSWYSVTQEAKKDLPHFPPHIIGAISIARRLIDPLSELVKCDPKRLQVGMYMRDIDGEQVKKAFHEVAVECVSFCGVDVNVASFDLLSKVAGLGPDIARKIIEKRSRDGLYTSRSQLKNIDGLSWKQFEQCAGFVKIMPTTSQLPIFTRKNLSDDLSNKRVLSSTTDYDPLDSTIIHPESYSSANTYLKLIGVDKDEIGRQSIRNKIKTLYLKYSLPEISQLCNTHSANMKLIIESLSNSIDFDYRISFKQIYVPEIQYFYELKEGSKLTGRVMNVTPMGAFIDCGIAGGINAYLNAKQCQKHGIAVNNNVLVTIVSIDKQMQRFKVSLLKVFRNNLNFS